jgi:hypothetical protein
LARLKAQGRHCRGVLHLVHVLWQGALVERSMQLAKERKRGGPRVEVVGINKGGAM